MQHDSSDVRPIPRPRQKSLPTDSSQLPDGHCLEKYSEPLLETPRQQLPTRGRLTADVRKYGDVWRKKLYVTNIPGYLHPYRVFRIHFERYDRRYCILSCKSVLWPSMSRCKPMLCKYGINYFCDLTNVITCDSPT